MPVSVIHTGAGGRIEVTSRSLERTLAGLVQAGQVGREASFLGRQRWMYRVEASAKRNAPVKSGRLRSDIHVETERGRQTRDLRQIGQAGLLDDVACLTRLPYARRQEVEHATKGHYMERAANEHIGKAAEDIGSEYQRLARQRLIVRGVR